MLVLSRKSGQSIQIGDDITITITRVGGNQVRVGIDAPLATPIRRGELELKHDVQPTANRLTTAASAAPAIDLLNSDRPLTQWLSRN